MIISALGDLFIRERRVERYITAMVQRGFARDTSHPHGDHRLAGMKGEKL
jgi:hypothetical protein